MSLRQKRHRVSASVERRKQKLENQKTARRDRSESEAKLDRTHNTQRRRVLRREAGKSAYVSGHPTAYHMDSYETSALAAQLHFAEGSGMGALPSYTQKPVLPIDG